MKAGPTLRTRRLAKVRALMGSSEPPRPRPPPCGGSSCARAASETHNRSGNSLMVAEYSVRRREGGLSTPCPLGSCADEGRGRRHRRQKWGAAGLFFDEAAHVDGEE